MSLTKVIFINLLLVLLSGCQLLPKTEAQVTTDAQKQLDNSIAVDVAIARLSSLNQAIAYTGTTEPEQIVSLRSQAEGRLLSLNVDVGDSVTKGQILATLDDNLLQAQVNQARSELAALEAELAQAETQVNETKTLVRQAQAELEQAQVDARRLEGLAQEGAIARQEAELAQTTLKTRQESLLASQEQVRTRQQAVVAASKRVAAQKAILTQAQENLSYTSITSPITGVVLERLSDTGNLIQPGEEILRLGEVSSIKVMVEVSELDLSKIRVGQPVQLTLDAFGDRQFSGRVQRISPLADSVTRLIPVEISLPNPEGNISSGLLARVNFNTDITQTVLIPETAVKEGKVFVLNSKENTPTVKAIAVKTGRSQDGLVEILSGLKTGDRYIVKSNRDLKDGDRVRLSIVSEQ